MMTGTFMGHRTLVGANITPVINYAAIFSVPPVGIT